MHHRLMVVAVLGSLVAALAACPAAPSLATDGGSGDGGPAGWDTTMGAHWEPGGGAVVFRIAAAHATRIELALFDAPTGVTERERVVLEPEPDDGSGVQVWRARVTEDRLPATVYYGYRVWGPNWPYDPAWQPGTETGWITDVDSGGNRMNPNKLVFDPYARELSHDPTTPTQPDGAPYATGGRRALDSALVAPKGIVVADEPRDVGTRPTRALGEDIIYEVHLRGLSAAASGPCAGTYAGAAARAAELASLGVTAVELLPIQETHNDRNDVDPQSTNGDNYWGYSTLAYFAPDRRYACDRSPGGPTREVAEMVRAFHAQGLKVFMDVVYNHTAEGGGGSLYSLRGVDNAGYYQLDRAGTGFTNSNGVGADLAGDKPLVASLVLDSLHYWHAALGIDGFRFDLAPILGNKCGAGCFTFDRHGLPERIATELAWPVAGGPGVDLIAEPWGVAQGTYQVGNFPAGWSEWNDRFRDTIRADQNQRGIVPITPGGLAARIYGSSDLFRHDGRAPAATINYLVSHDGLTLRDLYACNGANNHQAWPYGPSDGGTADNRAWDHGADPAAQRQAARTGLALLALSQGVPMITGGDEQLRSQRCNNNPYNLDSPATWLDWSDPAPAFRTFAQRLFQFRRAHPALRAQDWVDPARISWRDATGTTASGGYLDDASRPVLGWRLDGAALGDPDAALYTIYNRGAQTAVLTLPPPPPGLAWYRVADTSAGLEAEGNFAAVGGEARMQQARYDLGPRTLALFVARP